MKDDVAITPDMITEVIKAMGNNCGIFYTIRNDHTLDLNRITDQDLKILCDRKDLVHTVCWSDRPNSALFVNTLEYKYFPPGTPANDLFEYRMFKWNDMLWLISSIPLDKKDVLFQAAKDANVKLLEGFPCIIDKDGPHSFPMHSDNVYSTENVSGSDDGPGGEQDEEIAETFKIKQLFSNFYKEHLIDWEPSTDEQIEFEEYVKNLPHRSVWEAPNHNKYAIDQNGKYVFIIRGDDDDDMHKKLIILLNRMNWHMLDAREHPPIFKD
jgi:hypothetical protein